MPNNNIPTEENDTVVFGVTVEEFKGGFHVNLVLNGHNLVNIPKFQQISKEPDNQQYINILGDTWCLGVFVARNIATKTRRHKVTPS